VGTLLLRRLAQAIPLLLLVSIAVFALIHAAPGGPTAVFLANPGVRPEDIERLRRTLGVDQPLWLQYVRWLTAFVRGDWGYSFSDSRPVIDRVIERAPATLELVTASLGTAAIASGLFGMVAAITQGGWLDRLVRGLSAVAIAIPAFWLGLVSQLLFASTLGWLPSSGRTTLGDGSFADRISHLLLPALVLAGLHAAAWTRYVRASMIEVLRQPFVSAARARGAPQWRVLVRHVLRTALLPVVTVALLDAALLISGAVVTESVFAWPGLGTLFTEALARRDYPVLMAMLMVASSAIITVNVAADVLYALLDPRVST
jgi:peptide/nickel transport system permease protein